MSKVLLLSAVGALLPAWILISDCDRADWQQLVALFALPAVSALCLGAIGWRWPVGASTYQRLGVAVFLALFLGGLAWLSVVLVFVASCEG